MVQIPSTPMQAYLQDSQWPKPAAERENRKVIWCVCIVSNIPHENNFYGHFIGDQPTHVMNLWFIIYTFLEYHAAIISMLLSTNSHLKTLTCRVVSIYQLVKQHFVQWKLKDFKKKIQFTHLQINLQNCIYLPTRQPNYHALEIKRFKKRKRNFTYLQIKSSIEMERKANQVSIPIAHFSNSDN